MLNLLKTFQLGWKVSYFYITQKCVNQGSIASSYDYVSHLYEKTYLDQMHVYNDELLKQLLSDIPQGHIADLAGGTGYNCRYLKKMQSNYQIDLVDISPQMLSQADDFHKICTGMLEFLKKTESECYDGIICTWALMYEKPQVLLSECYRVLKKGGYMYILVNDKNTLPQVRKVFYKLLIEYVQRVSLLMMDLPTPRNIKQLSKWVQRCGFQINMVEEKKNDFCFSSWQDAASFVLSTGALAGYDQMLDFQQKDVFDSFVRLLETIDGQPCITHHFIKMIIQKEE